MSVDMHWQVQEAKQRFSELLRRAESEGPQFVTRHGREVAVVIDMSEYSRLKKSPKDLNDILLNAPRILSDDDMALFERSHEPDVRETPFVDW